MAVKISECALNEHGHLIDQKKKLILVQIGSELFFLEYARTIRSPKELSKLLDKHHVQLLKEDD